MITIFNNLLEMGRALISSFCLIYIEIKIRLELSPCTHLYNKILKFKHIKARSSSSIGSDPFYNLPTTQSISKFTKVDYYIKLEIYNYQNILNPINC